MAEKTFRVAGAVTLLLLAGSSFAESQPATLVAGTRLRVKLETPVSTSTSRPGDGVEARLTEPVNLRGQIVLPAGTYLAGRVALVRAGNRKEKRHATLRLQFETITLPDGNVLHAQASIQNLGLMLNVDAEGMVTQDGLSKGEAAGGVATGTAAGAGIGGIAGGGKGAAIGAGAGAALSTLGALAASSAQWQDFELKRGRKLWLRLDQDLVLAAGEPKAPTPERGL